MEKGRVVRSAISLCYRPAFAWAVAMALGLANFPSSRFEMNPDGISYLNLATLYQRGEWAAAANGYWSPLYPLLLAGWLKLVPAPPSLESTMVHVLTFVLYLGTFASFRFFLSELRLSQALPAGAETDSFRLSFQSFAEAACAYSLFFWAALSAIGFALVTPDMMLALVVFVAAGVTVRLNRTGSVRGYFLLGAIIGLAYLIKAVMFPVGIVMCFTCALPIGFRAGARRSAIAFAGFVLVSSPQLISMSQLAGHPSYGESGKVAYANEVNHIPKAWIGEPAGSGIPAHPMRRISQNLDAYLFATPNIQFSYPVSDQLAYWMSGVRTHFSVSEQFQVTSRIIAWYVQLFDLLLFAILVLYLLRRRVTPRYVSLIVPGFATFILYSLVFAEARYIGAWSVIIFLCVAAAIDIRKEEMRAAHSVLGALALFYLLSTLNLSRTETRRAIDMTRQHASNAQFQTATELERLGVKPGSRVAAIGYAFTDYWARLAGVQISMQVPDDKAYSAAPDSARARVLGAFSAEGAVAVVATGKPTPASGENWQQLGPAGYWVLMLKQGTIVPR